MVPKYFDILDLSYLDGEISWSYIKNSYFDLAIHQNEDVLQTRFFILFFYNLLYFFYPQNSRNTPPSIYERVAKIIKNHSTRNKSLKVVISKLSELVGKGRRYNKLIKTFGSAILVELQVRSIVSVEIQYKR